MNLLQRFFARLSVFKRREPACQPIFWTLESVHLARAYYVVAELGIADRLRAGPMTCEALAAATGAHSPSLFRVLRALAAFGVFQQDLQGRFQLTRHAWPLLDGVPGSVRHWVLFTGRSVMWQAYERALESVHAGDPGFVVAHDKSFYQYCRDNPDLNHDFIQGMSGWTDWQSREIVEAYDFGSFTHVVDVGGGLGSLIMEVLRRYPQVRGVLYDQAESIEAARSRLDDAGLTPRCKLVVGSFLDDVPAGGDAYLIKHVLRDWDDESVLRILSHCHHAMPPHARLLIIDATLDPRNNKDRLLKLIDLEQMSLLHGALRTREELERLLHETGFKLLRTIPTPVIDATILESRRV